jgi:hypothetical protein
MPEWAQELLHDHPQLVVAFTLAPLCYRVFAWVEDRLSANAKQELSVWLKSVGDFATKQTLSFNLSRFAAYCVVPGAPISSGLSDFEA